MTIEHELTFPPKGITSVSTHKSKFVKFDSNLFHSQSDTPKEHIPGKSFLSLGIQVVSHWTNLSKLRAHSIEIRRPLNLVKVQAL